MTLPSNSSMDFNPDNTAAQFMTKLTEVVELEGNWEVRLMEILLPTGHTTSTRLAFIICCITKTVRSIDSSCIPERTQHSRER